MEFNVQLDQFDGPLDLMLHLVSKNQLDLMDLDLDLLADQYVAYIMEVKQLQLDLASEYMTEFAWLLEYKSKRMLPRAQDEELDAYEEDQRDQLAARLLEYQKYKEAALLLEEQAQNRELQLSRPKDSQTDVWSLPKEEGNAKGSTYQLIKAMKRVVRRQQLLHPYQTSVEVKELSVEDRMAQLEKQLPYMKERCSLEDFCVDVSSLRAVIVTFLAVLELIHQQKVTFVFEECNGEKEVWICPRPNA